MAATCRRTLRVIMLMMMINTYATHPRALATGFIGFDVDSVTQSAGLLAYFLDGECGRCFMWCDIFFHSRPINCNFFLLLSSAC